jgi:hypothetical protein
MPWWCALDGSCGRDADPSALGATYRFAVIPLAKKLGIGCTVVLVVGVCSFIAWVAYALTHFSFKDVTPPARPPGVPSDAVWIGGPKGGAFGRCEPTSAREARCTVWNDYTGDVWMKGVFHLPMDAGGVDFRDKKPSYAGADGEHVYLADHVSMAVALLRALQRRPTSRTGVAALNAVRSCPARSRARAGSCAAYSTRIPEPRCHMARMI